MLPVRSEWCNDRLNPPGQLQRAGIGRINVHSRGCNFGDQGIRST